MTAAHIGVWVGQENHTPLARLRKLYDAARVTHSRLEERWMLAAQRIDKRPHPHDLARLYTEMREAEVARNGAFRELMAAFDKEAG